MEKIWEELVKIERVADSCRSEASDKSKEIIRVARDYSEKLLLDINAQASEEAEELLVKIREEAKKEHNDAVAKNEQFLIELENNAEKRIDEAVELVFNSVLEKR